MIFSIDDELCPYNTHSGELCSSSDPKFHAKFIISVHNKLFGLVVVNSFSKDTSCIASMSEFSETKTADMLHIYGFAQNLFVEFRCVEGEDRFPVQKVVDIGFD